SQDAVHLVGTDATGDTLSARLGHAEVHEVLGDIDHAGTLVHHDHAARSHDRSGLRQRFVIDRHIEAIGGQTAAGRPPGLHSFELATFRDASTNFVDHLAQGDSHRDFDEPGILDATGERENLGAFALLSSDRRVPLAAIANYRSNVGEG